MSKWKYAVSIVLIAASVIYSAVLSWVTALFVLLINVVMVSLFMLTKKYGGSIFVKIAYCAVMCYMLFGVVFGVYTTFNSVPQSIELSKYRWADLTLSVVKNNIPNILLLLGNVFPLIYCLGAKKEKK